MSTLNRQTTYLKIRIGQQVILIPLKQTNLVLPLVELQVVPHNDIALEGILNYHGQALPVYCLATLVGITKPSYDLDTPLLLCEISTGLLGVLVSEVLEVINLLDEKIQSSTFNNLMPYVEGIFEDQHGSAWLLDLEKLIINHNEKQNIPI